MDARHDDTYKALFNHREILVDFFRTYLPEEVQEELLFEDIERLNVHFQTVNIEDGTIEKREADMIWRIPTLTGESRYACILLEFQSSPNKEMILRVLEYCVLLWRSLLQHKRTTIETLPIILPVVLYHGSTPWTYATNIRDCVPLSPDSLLWKYQPQIEYIVVDVQRLTLSSEEGEHGLVSTMFAMQQTNTTEHMAVLVRNLASLLQQEQHASLRDAIRHWIVESLAPQSSVRIDPNHLTNFTEVSNMLENQLKRWENHAREKGLAEGLAEGRAEGLEQGRKTEAQNMLSEILELKYGPSETRAERISNLSIEQTRSLLRHTLSPLDEEALFALLDEEQTE